MLAFIEANKTVIFIVLLAILIAVLTWLSVKVTQIYSAVDPILNSGLGRALAST